MTGKICCNQIRYILLLAMSTACNTATYSPEELEAYVIEPKNGLFKVATSGRISYEVKYLPAELVASREIESGELTIDTLQYLLDKYRKSVLFEVAISSAGKEILSFNRENASYGETLQSLAFGMEKNIYLITSRDTLYPNAYMLDRTYGLGNTTKVLVAFPNLYSSDVQMVLKEIGVGAGTNRFHFRRCDLETKHRVELARK